MTPSRFFILVGISGAHCAMLALIIQTSGRPAQPITMPTVQGILISKGTATVKVREPFRSVPALPSPVPRSEPVVQPLSMAKAPPSERAISGPMPEARPVQGPAVPTIGNSAAPVPAASSRNTALSGSAAKSEGAETRKDRTVSAPASRLGHYLAVVKERVESYREYPVFARQAGHQGTVVVRVRIAADGVIGSVVVAQSSGYGTLDRAAVAAVKRASPFTAPGGFGLGEVTVEVPIVYRLTAS